MGHPHSFPRLGISFNADGSMWFDGLVHFDGEQFTVVVPPVGLGSGSPFVGAASVAPDGSVWLAMADGSCGPNLDCFDTTAGLYVITPEAVAAAE